MNVPAGADAASIPAASLSPMTKCTRSTSFVPISTANGTTLSPLLDNEIAHLFPDRP